MNRIKTRSFAKFAFAGALALFASVAFAATRTYVGPENGKWNVAENWQDGSSQSGVPANGDTIVLGTTSENDIEGLKVDRIEIAANATVTLTGNEIEITYNKGGTDTDAACGLYVPSSSVLNLYTPIAKQNKSGSADCIVRGSGVVNQYVSFPNFKKALKPTYAYWHIWNCDAFGGTANANGNFTFGCYVGGVRLHNASITNKASAIYANADKNEYPTRCALVAEEGVCTVNGANGANGNFPRAESGATLVLNGVNYSSSVAPCGAGHIVLTNKAWNVKSFGNSDISWGEVDVHTSSNSFKMLTTSSKSTINLWVKDALVATAAITNNLSMMGGLIRVYADQSCNGFVGKLSANSNGGTFRGFSTFGYVPTLTIVQNEPQYADAAGWRGVLPFGGSLQSKLSIVKRGPEFTALGGKSGNVRPFAMEGTFRVCEGTLGFVNADIQQSAGITVDAGATLAIGTGVTISSTAATLTVDGVMDLEEDLAIATGKATVGGTVLEDGTYGSSLSSARHVDNVHFTGGGMLTVGAGDPAAKTTAWTGGASTAKWSDAANWSNGKPVDGDTVVLAVPNTLTALDNDIAGLRLGALTLTVSNDFTMTGNALHVNEGGFALSTVETVPAHAYEVAFDVPMSFVGDQVWDVTTNATLHFKKSVSIGGDGKLTKNGMGTLRFDAANVMTGDITVNYGYLQVYAPENGLGDGTAKVDVWGTHGKVGDYWPHDAELHLYGATLNNVVAPYDQSGPALASIRAKEGYNVINGKIATSNTWYPTVAEGATLTLAGGVNVKNDTSAYLMRGIGGGTIIIKDTPMTVSSMCYSDDGAQPIQWIVSTNVIVQCAYSTKAPNCRAHIVGRSADLKIKTTVPYAFDSHRGAYPGSGYLNYFNGTFDVNGYSQCVGGFGIRSENTKVNPENGTLTNSSDTPATLELYQNLYPDNPVYGGKITGPLTILKSGQYPLTFGLPSTGYASKTAVFETTGDLCVTQGVLTVNAKAKFTNIGAVRVSGTGTLNLEAADNLPQTANLVLDNTAGASISVADGVTIRVDGYTLNGKKQPTGTYQFGAGYIRAGRRGLVITVR